MMIEDELNLDTSKLRRRKIFIKRPVIFICNDMYSKGLRNLR